MLVLHGTAATVLYTGDHFNFESVTNDAGTGWRNTSTVKPLDADGDNIYGTDGYEFGGGGTPNALPTYVNSFTISGGHNDGGRGDVDNPADPSGVDINGGWAGRSVVSTTFASCTFNQTLSQPIRLGVIYDNDWSASTGEQIFTLT